MFLMVELRTTIKIIVKKSEYLETQEFKNLYLITQL